MQKTTRTELQERQDAPLVLPSSAESFNATSLQTNSKVNSPVDNSKLCSHSRSGCNLHKGSSVSAHFVFVLDKDGKPLTPCKPAKAKKLMKSEQAVPVWNKFGQFGIQMLVGTRKETPTTVLGVDFGTKFEGYVVVTGKENNLAVMWLLPDKKQIVRKIEERKIIRHSRRWRNYRKRACKLNNKISKEFIAPSQKVIIQSRMKSINEFFKCYPITNVAIEDVCFNHKYNKWGKNFSTLEIGKNYIYNEIKQNAELQLFSGRETPQIRKLYNYKKSKNKSAQIFNSHCSDALAIATEIYAQEHIKQGKMIVVDDKYRYVRRKLHDISPGKNNIRQKYSTGTFKGVKKGIICEKGQICGGTKNIFRILNKDNFRVAKTHLIWLSHKFKCLEV